MAETAGTAGTAGPARPAGGGTTEAGGAGSATPPYSWGGLTYWPPRQAAESLLRRKLARDVALLQASNMLQKAYGLVFSVVAARLLGLTTYGEYVLVLSLYQTFNLLGSLGLGQFLVVPLAQAAAAGDREEVAQAAGYNVKLSLLISSGVCLLALAIGPWFGSLMMPRPELAHLGGLMRILALGAIPAVGYNVATTALQSVRRMKELALVENVDGLLARAPGLVAVLAGFGLPGLLWGIALGGLLSSLHGLYQYHRVAVRHHGFPGLRRLLAAAWRVPFRKYFRFSSLAVVDKNVSQFFGQTPMLFLGRWAGPEHAAYFNVASKVFTLLAAFHGAASKAFSVRLSQEFGRHGPEATRRLFWRCTLAWGSIASVAAAAFILLIPVYRYVYGAEYLPSVALVAIFAAFTAKQGFTVALGSIFLIMNRVATNVLARLPLMAVAMPVGALLVQRWGATGAAAYQLAAFAAGDLIYFSILATPWFWRTQRAGRVMKNGG